MLTTKNRLFLEQETNFLTISIIIVLIPHSVCASEKNATTILAEHIHAEDVVWPTTVEFRVSKQFYGQGKYVLS